MLLSPLPETTAGEGLPRRKPTFRLLFRRVAGITLFANRHSSSLPRPSAIPYDQLRLGVHAEQEFLRLPTDRIETIVLDYNPDPLDRALH